MDNEESTINNFFDSRIASCNGTYNLVETGRILHTNNKRHVIVKNDSDQILGEISAEDISFPKLLQRRNFSELKRTQATSITKDLWCVTKDCPMYYVVEHFIYKNTKYVCIVNNQKEKNIVGEYELDSLLKYLWEWINKEIYNKKHEKCNEINELLNEKLTDINANTGISAIEHILKKVKTCGSEISIMKMGMLMNFDKEWYMGVNGNTGVNGNYNLSGFVNFDKMNIFSILFEAKKRNILVHHLKAKNVTNNKIFVGGENLKIGKCIDLSVKEGVEIFLTNEKISYERLCKEGIVKFLGKIYLSSVIDPFGYWKYKNIFKISSNVNIHKKATSQSAIKNRDRTNLKKKPIPKFAKDIMNVNPTTCGNTETLVKIGDIMAKNNFNHIIITNEKNIPVSVVSAENITMHKMIMGEGLEGIKNTKICDIMNEKIWCANIQTPFINLMHKMAADRIGCLPITNNYGNLVGIVTKTDIFEGVKQLIENSKEIREKIYSIKVSEIMNHDISLCFEDDSAIKKDIEMSKHKIKYLLVIDRNTKKITGIVSLNDFILGKMRKEKNMFMSMSSVKIKEVMNRDIATVDEDYSITDVINIMLEKHLSVVPVLEKDTIKGQVEWWMIFEKLLLILSPFYAKM